MNLEELEARLRSVEDQLEIDKLEKMYGYYLDNNMPHKIVDMFSDDCDSIQIANRGVFKGKEGVRKFCLDFLGRPRGGDKGSHMAFHHQLQGVVNIAPDGKTAKGRWQLIWFAACPEVTNGPMTSVLGHGVYENEFVKVDGKWKFQKISLDLHFLSPINKGWTEVPIVGHMVPVEFADGPSVHYSPYPNITYLPFHWEEQSTR